jgi:tetratricopeptide (TPR) repeat protein
MAQSTEQRLQQQFDIWLAESGEAVIQAKGLDKSLLDQVDMENGVLTFTRPSTIRWECKFHPGADVTDAQVAAAEEQLEVLLRDPDYGFLRANLEQVGFDSKTADYRDALANAEVILQRPEREEEEAEEENGGGLVSEESESISWIPMLVCCPQVYRAGCWLRRRMVVMECECWCVPVICGASPQEASPAPAEPVPGPQPADPVEQLPSRLAKAKTEQEQEPASQPVAAVSTADILRHFEPADNARQPSFVSLQLERSVATSQERALASEVFGLVYHAYWNEDYQGALEKTELALSLDPGDARIWYYRGFAQLALGQQQEACACLAEAVKRHPAGGKSRAAVDAALQRIQGDLRVAIQRAVLLAPPARDEARPPAVREDVDRIAQAD